MKNGIKQKLKFALTMTLVVALLLPTVAFGAEADEGGETGNSQFADSVGTADGTEMNSDKECGKVNPQINGSLEEKTPKRSLRMHIGSQAVSIWAGGETIEKNIETMPMVVNSRTLVPLRFICEDVLDCNVEYVAQNQTVVLTRKDIRAVVDLHSKVVEVEYSDGTEDYPQMDQPPLLKNDYTYMPLRFFSELFGCDVEYNPDDKSILINDYFDPEIEIEPVDRPVPQLEFGSYIVGQPTFTCKDTSYDKNGLAIVDRQFKITVGGKTYSGTDLASDLTSCVKKINKAGNYTVYYRVKNSDNVWSEWYGFVLNVKENLPPVISGFKCVKANDSRVSTVNSGEKIDFIYNIENEEWEDIVAEEWSYSWTSNGYEKNMHVKPDVLYYMGGSYKVTLSVKDAAGNWGSATVYVSPRKVSQSKEAYNKFTNLVPGEVYLNDGKHNFNEAKTAEPKNIEFEDVTLLASNNPESVEATGILAADKISGDARLRFHHKNCTGGSVKFFAIAKNETDHPVTITVGQNAAAGPSTGVLQVGVSVVERYMIQSYKKVTKVLQPGEIYLVNQNAPTVKDGSSAAALIDVSSDDEITYNICCMKASSSYKDYEYLMPAVKNSTHIRGTFAQATMSMDYTFSGKTTEKIILGREDAFDGYFRTGTDALTGEDVINKGNRGVVHNITVTADKKVGLLFNPRGTAYVGVILIDGKIVDLSIAGMMAGIAEGCILDVMEAGETKEITYVVPSGSDSPVLIVAIPESQWKNY